MRTWLLRGTVCAILSLLTACNAYIQTLQSPLTSLIATPVSPAATPTRTPFPKEVEITAMSMTAAAQPTAMPTQAIPKHAPLCTTSQLSAGYAEMGGATMHDFIYLPITNTSSISCVLQAPANIQLIDPKGNTLPVDYHLPQRSISPTGEPLKLYVRPDEGVMFMLDWGNWCMPLGREQITVRVSLAGDKKPLNIPLPIPFFYGHCLAPNARSTLFVLFLVRVPK